MRLLVADDHDLVREMIALFLQREADAEVVSAESVDAAVELAERTGTFDLVILDYNMPGMMGLRGLERMIAANEQRPVAILSGTASPQIAQDAIAAGAAGFIPKTLGSKSMIRAIQFMVAGETYIPAEFMRQPQSANMGNLTERETEVLRGLCEGKSNKEIARDLSLQEVTIKLHVKTLCRKIDAKNRTQAAMIARDHGMF